MMEQLCEADEESSAEDAPVAATLVDHREIVKVEETTEIGHDAPELRDEPLARHEVEQQLEQIFLRLTGELSDLTRVKLLPQAKALYETLHPETRHGGAKQVAKLAAWPSFVVHLAERWGVSERTAYRRLEAGEALEKLDSEAERLCYGTRLASKLGLLVRIAAIPKAELHRDIVTILLRNQTKGVAELCKWEDEFGLTKLKPPKPKNEEQAHETQDGATDLGHEDDGAEDDDSDLTDDVVTEQGGHESDDVADESGAAPPAPPDSNIADVIEVLGVSTATDCVAAIQDLQTTAQQLRVQLKAAEEREAKLQAELKMYRGSQLGQLFEVLGAKTAGQALAKARALKGGRDAA